MKRTLPMILILALLATVASAQGRKSYNFGVVDELGQPVTASLTATITKSGSAETVYDGPTGTGTATTSAVTTGYFKFWTAESTVDIAITDGTNTIYVTNFSPTDHIIILRTTYAESVKRPVITITADATLTAGQSGAVIIASKTGTLSLTLPAASKGLTYTIVDPSETAANDVSIVAPAGSKINGGTAGKKYECTDDAVGSVTTLTCDGTDWYVTSEKGTWANNDS